MISYFEANVQGKTGIKKALREESFQGRGNDNALPFLSAQVIVQVLVLVITECFVVHPLAVHAGDGLFRFLPGEIIVKCSNAFFRLFTEFITR